MKILIVNTFDKGGAANACLRLYEDLLNENIAASLLLQNKKNNIPNAHTLNPNQKKQSVISKIQGKFRRVLKKLKLLVKEPVSEDNAFLKSRSKGLEWFSFPTSNFDITNSPLYQEADIVNLHWVAGFLDYESFFKKNKKPLIWTLHDMHPFTGGEHYEEKYLGMDADGFPLKRAKTNYEKNVSSKNQRLIIKALKKVQNLTIVAPSTWLATEAKKSDAFQNRKVYCIPYGLNSEIFKPHDRKYSRELLNLPKDKKVILFVADSISNNRKGFVYLKKAFEKLERNDVVLCAIGQSDNAFDTKNNVLELGLIQDERIMSIAFSAADVFVIPSLMDNLPNTVLESLMCGTPVIGFPVGGILDMVAHGKNGLLAKEVSVDALLESLNIFLNNIEHFDRKVIRTEAIKKYDLKVQTKAYLTLFENILDKKNDKRTY
ncbi:MAG: hypothetical protein CML03_07615 [Pseudooceanicola sp.]|nr:hypothetical protein [Pseudooceanicola sp.]